MLVYRGWTTPLVSRHPIISSSFCIQLYASPCPTPHCSLVFLTYATSCPTLCRSLPSWFHDDVVLVGYIPPLIPLLLNVKCPNTVVFPLVRKQDTLEPFPYLLAITLAPHRNIDISDLIDPNQSCAKVVKTETTFNEISPPLHIISLQWNPKSPETPLCYGLLPQGTLRGVCLHKAL